VRKRGEILDFQLLKSSTPNLETPVGLITVVFGHSNSSVTVPSALRFFPRSFSP